MDEGKIKVCARCGDSKDISMFRKVKWGFYSYCRPCEVSYRAHLQMKHQADYDLLNPIPLPYNETIAICSHFGCGRQLLLTEQLCGNRCIDHMAQENTDITFIINQKR